MAKKTLAELRAEAFAAGWAQYAIKEKARKKAVASGQVPLPLARPKGKTNFDKRARKKARVKGDPAFIAPLQQVHGARGKPPKFPRIESWIKARRNVEWWRNRDGSINAIATFRGRKAWDKAVTAATRIPLAAYCAFRYQLKKDLDIETSGGSSSDPSSIASFGFELVTKSTPTTRAEHWAVSYAFVFSGFDKEEASDKFYSGVYLRLAGLAVYWPSPDAPPKPKRYKKKAKR